MILKIDFTSTDGKQISTKEQVLQCNVKEHI